MYDIQWGLFEYLQTKNVQYWCFLVVIAYNLEAASYKWKIKTYAFQPKFSELSGVTVLVHLGTVRLV